MTLPPGEEREKVTMYGWQVLVTSLNISEDLRHHQHKGGGGIWRE